MVIFENRSGDRANTVSRTGNPATNPNNLAGLEGPEIVLKIFRCRLPQYARQHWPLSLVVVEGHRDDNGLDPIQTIEFELQVLEAWKVEAYGVQFLIFGKAQQSRYAALIQIHRLRDFTLGLIPNVDSLRHFCSGNLSLFMRLFPRHSVAPFEINSFPRRASISAVPF